MWRLLRRANISPHGDAYILNAKGRLIAHRDMTLVQQGRDLSAPKRGGIRRGLRGDLVILASRSKTIGNTRYTFVAEAELIAELAPTFRLITANLLILLVGLIIAVRFARINNDNIVRPVERIAQVARGVGEGQLSLRTGLKGVDEICALGQVFDEMTDKVQHLMAKTEEQNKALVSKNDQIRHQALHDALTGLPNRRYLDQHLRAVESAAKDNGGDFAVLHIDLDRFKEINDTMSHSAGDCLLVHVATLLNESCGAGDIVFRAGGDEFVVVIHGAMPEQPVEVFIKKFSQLLERPISFEGSELRSSASIGIAFGRDAALDAGTVLSNADIALYESKHGGRNRSQYFTPALQKKIATDKALADEILIALERQEFFPVFQPQFYTRSLELRGVETLCRWQHPERGVLAPAGFLALAENRGLLCDIDQMIFAQSAKALHNLRQQGIQIPKISFNMTASRLELQDLSAEFREKIPASTEIAIEILESISLDVLSPSQQASLKTYRADGIRIEIDDFGSCRASIAGLISVSPHALKIDRAIIDPIVRSEQHMRLVEAIVGIGDALSIEVVAEGVETVDHIRILKQLGCASLQGYALARPMPVEDLTRFLQNGPPPALLAA